MTDKAKRDNKNKPQLHYVAAFPEALRELARVCEHGASKYEPYNFLKGAPESEHLSAAMRHILCAAEGFMVDFGSNCDHRLHAVWNLMRWYEESVMQPKGFEADLESYQIVLPAPSIEEAPTQLIEKPVYQQPEFPALYGFYWESDQNWSNLSNTGWSILFGDSTKRIYQVPEGRYAGMYSREDGTVHSTFYEAAHHISQSSRK